MSCKTSGSGMTNWSIGTALFTPTPLQCAVNPKPTPL